MKNVVSRRGLLARFAAIAAAVAVASAVKAEAASSPNLTQAEIDALYVEAHGPKKVDSWAPRQDTGILIGGSSGWNHPLKIIGGDTEFSEVLGTGPITRATPNEITPGQIARMWNREVSRLYPSEKALT